MVFQPTTFGRYVLLKRIAIGGMAEIFRSIAYGAEGFEKVVAIKRMLPHLSSDHQFVDMFINEAKLAASLSHANIVQIYDFGCIDNLLFLSMEYVHGKDISEITGGLRTRQQSTPVELACHVFIEVLNGLHHAHRQRDHFGNPLNLIHRDMSPPNIIVSYDGEVKIADFGIAKATRTKVQTSSGVLKGKYSYMSPEQANGQLLDRRTDIFSLGICFYEMLTLTEAFSGNSELEVLRKVRTAEITPPREHNPNIPEALEAILLKALAKKPDDRYASAAEWRDALEQFLVENNLRYSTSALSGFIRDLFQAEIMKEREQLALEAQTAEDLRPEARSIARLEATAAGELDTLIIDQDEHTWPPGEQSIDQGAFADEESGDDTTIRVDMAQLGLDDPRAPASRPPPPADLQDSDFEDLDDEDEETELLEEIPAEMVTREQPLPVSALAQVRPPTADKPAQEPPPDEETPATGSLPAPEVVVGKPVSFPSEPITETREDFSAPEEPSVITEREEQHFEIREPTFEEVQASEENVAEEKSGFPLMYLLFGILVAAVVVGLIALLGSHGEEEKQEPAGDAGIAEATTGPSSSPAADRTGADAGPDETRLAVKTPEEKTAKPPEPSEPPDSGAAPPEEAAPAETEPKEITASRTAVTPPAPEKKAEPQKKPRPEKKKSPRRRSKRRKKKKLSSRSRRRKSRSRRRRRRKRRRKSSRSKRRSHRRKKSSGRKSKAAQKKTTRTRSGATTTLIVDGVPVNNLSGLEKKLRPGVHLMELRDKNGKVLRRWKVQVGDKSDN